MSRRRRTSTFGCVRRLPSGRWRAEYTHDGGRYSGPGTFPTKVAAEDWLAGVRTDIGRGAWSDPSAGKVNLRKYADTWLAHRHDLAERSRELYRWLLDKRILPEFGDRQLAAITPSQVRAWNATLAADHPSTAAKAYRLLSTIMRTAVDDRHLVVSPCKVRGAGRETAAERPVAAVAEVQTLADAMPPHLGLAVLLAAFCSLRKGEVLALRRRHMNPLKGTVRVEKAVVVLAGGRVLEKEPKTTAGRRTVTIPPNLLPMVEQHLAEHTDDHVTAPLFDVSPRRLDIAWRKAREKVGREDLHFHDLRHAGATWLAIAGATTAELMARVGHASPAAALRYQHATRDRDRVLAQALAEMSSPQGRGDRELDNVR